MSLVQEIEALRDRVLAELNAVFDYFEHTKAAWLLIRELSAEGRRFDLQDTNTRTTIDSDGLTSLAQVYVRGYLAESVFQHLVALVEDFVFSLIRSRLLSHPEGIPNRDKKSVDLATIIEASDKAAILEVVIERELDALKYKRPAAWFDYLRDRVNLGGPTSDQVERLAEIKASRDLLVHNRGVVNETYLDKAGPRARYAEGQRLEIQQPYLYESWSLFRVIVSDLSAAAIAKARPRGDVAS